MSENGFQLISVTFMKACYPLGTIQTFTSSNNSKGNAERARFMRTLKEELLWLREWSSTRQVEQALPTWVE